MVPLVRLGSLVIHLPNILEVNVDPLGLIVEEGGARVFPEKFPPAEFVMGADAVTGADAIVDIVDANEGGPTLPTMGNTPVIGTAGAELTPRLLISVESNGIPVRAKPPGVVGAVDVGVDDEAMLLEPEPHIPDIPEVSSIPEDADIPAGTDGTDICDDVDVPGVAVGSVVAAVAGAAVPAAVPPPSYVAVDPYIPDGKTPADEHVVPPLVIAPVLGIAIVPVTLVVGVGLTPSDVSSVASSGIPAAPTEPWGPIPSGEVAPSEGTAVSGSSIWANAGLQHNSSRPTTAIQIRFIEVSLT
jgi:hypothetical protein